MAKARGLQIVEDAACAIGSRYRDQPIGSHGDLVCFSFHPRKVITTGEGGIITTGRSDYAERLRLLRQHGMSVSDTVRHSSQKVVIENYVCLGYNYRMTDIQAGDRRRADEAPAEDRGTSTRIGSQYTKALRHHPWLRPPYVPDDGRSQFPKLRVRLTSDAPVSRDELMQRLLEQGIATRRGIMLAHLEPACADLSPPALPRSEEASQRSLLLPLYPQMTNNDLQQVLAALGSIA